MAGAVPGEPDALSAWLPSRASLLGADYPVGPLLGGCQVRPKRTSGHAALTALRRTAGSELRVLRLGGRRSGQDRGGAAISRASPETMGLAAPEKTKRGESERRRKRERESRSKSSE